MQMLRNWDGSRFLTAWADEFGANASLRLQADYTVQASEHDGTPQYGQFVLSIVDIGQDNPAYSNSLWMTISIMDSRGYGEEGVHFDTGGTPNFIIFTYAGEGLQFVTPSPGSQLFGGGGCDCSHYSVTVSRQNLVGVGTEMYSPSGYAGWVGSRVSDFSVSTDYRVVVGEAPRR